MPNYQNGKVYALRNTEDGDIYVGGTTMTLHKRLIAHNTQCRRRVQVCMMLYDHMRYHGLEKFYMTLLEDVPCSDAKVLHEREGYWIREIGTLNKRVSGRSLADYYMDNQEAIIEKVNRYALKNRDKLQAKVECDCGGSYIFRARAPHLRTKRHQAHMDFLDRMSDLGEE